RVYGVEKQFLLAVAKTESNFTPTATSGSGAMGIMQLMPATAESMNVEHPYDPYENIMGGAKLLAIYLDKYDGDKAKTLAAYNAGGNRVDEYGGVPNEIWGYVNKVMGYYREGIDIPGASSTYAASNGAGSVTYASQSVTDKLKTEFSKFPEHQSYEMFLQELTTELQSEETPSDADQAYRMLLGSAKNAIDRVRNQILADPTLLARGQSDLRIGDVDDDEDEEDWEIDDIDEDDEDYEDDDIDDIDDEDDYDDDDEYDYDDEDD
ncbi:MAG: lytic transglycosylase domain-containing protein, partial [Lachnospiraceae bacterium]|nr:lytic transglycosylase domain-containing protein [Lachnospiraceae bacterium]